MTALEQLQQAPNLRDLLDQLERSWAEEQRRRHEFWADADEGVKAEFIVGEIIYHSPIYGRQWKVSTRITRYLTPHVYDNGLGEVGYEKVMIRLTRNDYEPDICFWNAETASTFQQKQSAFPPPDFIVEILSDSTQHRDYGIKMTDYALHGIKEYWIVDTDQETIEQYLPNGNTFFLAQKLKDGVLTSAAVAGFRITVRDVFAE